MSQVGIGAMIVVQIGSSNLVCSASDDIMLASKGTDSGNISTSYVKIREIKIGFAGYYRVKSTISGAGGTTVYYQIYKNGVPYGTVHSGSSYPVNGSDDLYFAHGDLVQLYTKTANGAYAVISEYLAICGTLALSTVTLDPVSPICPDLGYVLFGA